MYSHNYMIYKFIKYVNFVILNFCKSDFADLNIVFIFAADFYICR
jgi:hypothetical protein